MREHASNDIELDGAITSEDLQVDLPNAGALFWLFDIMVPEALDVRGIYPAEVLIYRNDGTQQKISTVVGVERGFATPAGEKRDRILSVILSKPGISQNIVSARIKLTISPERLESSKIVEDFKKAMRGQL